MNHVPLLIGPDLIKVSEAFAALVSFIVSLLAAVWALELYQLLRTGAIGKSWKILIAAAIVFMVHEVTNIVRIFGTFSDLGLYDATKVLFVLLLAWGFYVQRDVFNSPHMFRAVLNHRRPYAQPAAENLEVAAPTEPQQPSPASLP